jgi:hypothetical protein
LCFVFRLSCTITPHHHLISHSYRRTVSPPDIHTYIHTYIPWDVIHSPLGHCSLPHPFFDVLIFFLLSFVCLYPYLPLFIHIYNIHPSISPFHLLNHHNPHKSWSIRAI